MASEVRAKEGDAGAEAKNATSDATSSGDSDYEQLLARLIELESLLEDDLARKLKHQKPKLQQDWQEEISQLTIALGLG